MSRRIEEQKGPITPSRPPVEKMKTRAEKTSEDIEHNAIRRSGQTLTLHEPKTGRK